MKIDIEKLREDLKNDSLGAFFGGALIEASDLWHASDEELIEIARRKGTDLRSYLSDDDDN